MAKRENWKPVPGFEGYEVSDQGRVRSLDRTIRNGRGNHRFAKGRMLKEKWGAGYAIVFLTGQTPMYIHHLVLLTFVGPRPRRKIVRHRDDNRHNNKLSNLCYGTRRENWDDAVKSGMARLGSRNHFAKLTEAAVKKIQKSTESRAVLAARYGVALATITNARCGRSWGWLNAHD